MKIDALVAEIGSTTTVINAFNNLQTENPVFLGQGQAPTSVNEGDVNIGLTEAIKSLQEILNVDKIEYEYMFATSSAAGGLKMSVHGLVYDMTVKAAKEAALGAGANLHMVTSGKITRGDLLKLEKLNPNIILIAGGVDYGERETALYNSEKIAALPIDVPVIYGGNIENVEDVKLIFEEQGKLHNLHIVPNVYPKLDSLNIEPTRKVIQEVFEKHITEAKGMEKIRKIVNETIIPTPGAVMKAAQVLKEKIGDLVVIDVGGATTDVHSVTEGTEKVNKILVEPEPTAKRTVEGDLGVYINTPNIVNLIKSEVLGKELGVSVDDIKIMVEKRVPIPKTENEIKFTERLTKEAVLISVDRHAGGYRTFFGGKSQTLAYGKDLTGIRWIVGTGGALTRLPKGREILKEIAFYNKGDKLFPTQEAQILLDNDYIMASLGVLSMKFKKAAQKLMLNSLQIEDIDLDM